MKTARVLTYDYHYWFEPDFRDRFNISATQLYKKMTKWLGNTLEISDYRTTEPSPGRWGGRYQIDFRCEEHYSFFALCWDSQVDDYHNSYKVKRNR